MTDKMDAYKKKQLLAAMMILESSTSDSSSEDEDFLFLSTALGCDFKNYVKKNVGFVQEDVNNMANEQFKKHFRVNRETCELVNKKFSLSPWFPIYDWKGGREQVDADNYILIFLWYMANKASMREVAVLFGISESMVWKIINIVMDFLVDEAPNQIKMPNTSDEKEYAAREFQKISGLEIVIGCIDGSYINIQKPKYKVRSTYINRHDNISITLQGICNHRKQFIDVFTGCPSKIRDARVYKWSQISKDLEKICAGKYHILGDGAYEIREWLITPYRGYDNLPDQKKKFNTKLSQTRVVIENAFGILKKRFIQLIRIELRDVNRITKLILSCCVLHNICIELKDNVEDDVPISFENSVERNEQRSETQRALFQRRLGEIKRDEIAESLI